ncbi:MAG: hypothetical protein M1828_003495 [Chrysothrix sp. TS-e1954]|nr:MAG: hypothetical protein M1828_003495 [Chrysothrix sp. TS-e1954]
MDCLSQAATQVLLRSSKGPEGLQGIRLSLTTSPVRQSAQVVDAPPSPAKSIAGQVLETSQAQLFSMPKRPQSTSEATKTEQPQPISHEDSVEYTELKSYRISDGGTHSGSYFDLGTDSSDIEDETGRISPRGSARSRFSSDGSKETSQPQNPPELPELPKDFLGIGDPELLVDQGGQSFDEFLNLVPEQASYPQAYVPQSSSFAPTTQNYQAYEHQVPIHQGDEQAEQRPLSDASLFYPYNPPSLAPRSSGLKAWAIMCHSWERMMRREEGQPMTEAENQLAQGFYLNNPPHYPPHGANQPPPSTNSSFTKPPVPPMHPARSSPTVRPTLQSSGASTHSVPTRETLQPQHQTAPKTKRRSLSSPTPTAQSILKNTSSTAPPPMPAYEPRHASAPLPSKLRKVSIAPMPAAYIDEDRHSAAPLTAIAGTRGSVPGATGAPRRVSIKPSPLNEPNWSRKGKLSPPLLTPYPEESDVAGPAVPPHGTSSQDSSPGQSPVIQPTRLEVPPPALRHAPPASTNLRKESAFHYPQPHAISSNGAPHRPSRRPTLHVQSDTVLTLSVPRRYAPNGRVVSSLVVPADADLAVPLKARRQSVPQAILEKGKKLELPPGIDFDDALLFWRMREQYNRKLLGSNPAACFWRRHLSARILKRICVVSVAAVPLSQSTSSSWPHHHTSRSTADEWHGMRSPRFLARKGLSDTFSEVNLINHFRVPNQGRARYTWVQWAHRVARDVDEELEEDEVGGLTPSGRPAVPGGLEFIEAIVALLLYTLLGPAPLKNNTPNSSVEHLSMPSRAGFAEGIKSTLRDATKNATVHPSKPAVNTAGHALPTFSLNKCMTKSIEVGRDYNVNRLDTVNLEMNHSDRGWPIDDRLETSDYGSDIDSDAEAQLVRLMEGITVDDVVHASPKAEDSIIQSIETDEQQNHGPVKRRPRVSASNSMQFPAVVSHKVDVGTAPIGPSIEIEYEGDDLFDDIESFPPTDDSPGRIRFEKSPLTSSTRTTSATTPDDVEARQKSPPDTRSPLQRFRTQPRKPLSVTDLISPAWCELQYLFNLSRFGKKPATPAMKRGSSVHKELEEQVYETVQVEVQSREDHWGLRIWNVIQGLRTLRVTGMTRELEIWGVLDGEVVNGVIDELSYSCTDAELEARLSSMENDKKTNELPQNQQTISQFFASQRQTQQPPTQPSPSSSTNNDSRKIYLTDIKTRAASTLPKPSALKPTHMQLMLYHHLLTRLATGKVDPTILFARYDVQPNRRFSDPLIATVASLDCNFHPSANLSSTAPVESPVAAVIELAHHNTLSSLWDLMMGEFRATIPAADAVSRVLNVEFRRSADGSVLGRRTFPHVLQQVEAYVADEMDWWKGRREARGVDVEEAFKCGICEFSEGCEWRKGKVEDAVERSRKRKVGAATGK